MKNKKTKHTNKIWWMAWITDGFEKYKSQQFWIATEKESYNWEINLN